MFVRYEYNRLRLRLDCMSYTSQLSFDTLLTHWGNWIEWMNLQQTLVHCPLYKINSTLNSSCYKPQIEFLFRPNPIRSNMKFYCHNAQKQCIFRNPYPHEHWKLNLDRTKQRCGILDYFQIPTKVHSCNGVRNVRWSCMTQIELVQTLVVEPSKLHLSWINRIHHPASTQQKFFISIRWSLL